MSRLFRWLKMDITLDYPGTNENRARNRDPLSVPFLSLFLNIGYDALPLFIGVCHCKKCSRGRLPKCNQDVSRLFSEQLNHLMYGNLTHQLYLFISFLLFVYYKIVFYLAHKEYLFLFTGCIRACMIYCSLPLSYYRL